MEVKIQKTFPIGASAAAAWKVLSDIRAVAACMPGAAITEQLSETKYKGNVRIKLGPAAAAFDGDIDILGLDAQRREMRLLGTGQDSRGSSGASMDLTARIVAVDEGRSELIGESKVAVTGKFANFGGRMMEQVSNQILNQFAGNFENRAIAAQATLGGAHVDQAEAAAAAARITQQPKELNAFALVLAIVKNWITRLFKPT